MRFFVLISMILALASAAKPNNGKAQKIVGGSVTTVQEYPFMTSMLYTFFTVWTYQACGGSLLTSQTILSSAQCYYGDAARDWTVRVGANNGLTGGSVHTVTELRLHPQYDDWTLDFDVAIVRLSTAVTLGTNVGTVLVAGSGYVLGAGTQVSVLGYGTSSYNGADTEVLHKADVNIVDQTLCTQRYAELKQTPGFGTWPDVTQNMLCAGLLDVGGRDACQHDAGGPLTHNNNVVVGLVSWGRGCGEAYYPGVYTSVAQNVEWIVANGAA